jgi:hypothetical protein
VADVIRENPPHPPNPLGISIAQVSDTASVNPFTNHPATL